MITAIHRHDTDTDTAPACRRVAFHYDEDGAPMDRIDAKRVKLPDGTAPKPGDTMTCGSCGAQLAIESLDLVPGKLDVRAIN
jgi:hypothetical protein